MKCKYAEIFCWKNVSSFCRAKATHIFSAKNIRILYIESAKMVNEMTLNELVKLTTLWTTGPCIIAKCKWSQIYHNNSKYWERKAWAECRPRSDTAECRVRSGSTLFATYSAVFIDINKKERKRVIMTLGLKNRLQEQICRNQIRSQT